MFLGSYTKSLPWLFQAIAMEGDQLVVSPPKYTRRDSILDADRLKYLITARGHMQVIGKQTQSSLFYAPLTIAQILEDTKLTRPKLNGWKGKSPPRNAPFYGA
jgi:hypothetical protein